MKIKIKLQLEVEQELTDEDMKDESGILMSPSELIDAVKSDFNEDWRSQLENYEFDLDTITVEELK